MSISKKNLFINALALPIVGMICLTSIPNNAIAGFKWTAPTATKTQFSMDGMKNHPNIHWGKRKTVTDLKEAPFVEEALPAPVTMETLATLQKAEVKTAHIDIETPKEIKIVPTTHTNMSMDSMPADVISEVVKEDKILSTQKEMHEFPAVAMKSQAKAYAPKEKTRAKTKTVFVTPSFTIKDAKKLEGFGNEIPLVVAIRQIIPEGHPFAFKKGVNLATRVSWNGGKAWTEVLNETLFSLGLAAVQYNNVIMIDKAPTKTILVMPSKQRIDAITTKEVKTVTVIAPIKVDKTMVTLPLWRSKTGQTLRNVISEWSKRENVKLFWDTDYDYRLNKDILLEGSYETVLEKLLNEFSDVDPQPYGQISKNGEGQRILTIATYNSSS